MTRPIWICLDYRLVFPWPNKESMMNHSLDDTFDIEVVEPIRRSELVTVDGRAIIQHDVENIDKNVDDDYEVARNNLRSLLEQGHEALSKAFQVAISSEHPTAFEVAGQIMSQLAEINSKLLELSEKRVKLKQAVGKGAGPDKVVNNAIFIGSTSKLAELLKGEC